MKKMDVSVEFLLKCSYKTFIENCVYQQDSVALTNGLLMIEAIGDYLKIMPTLKVKEALKSIDVKD